MKNRNSFTKVMLLIVAAVMLFSLTALAVTPREMRENGEVSDGSVVYGDKRDGIVSDVSSDMSDLGNEVSEFAESVLPGDNGIGETHTSDTQTTEVRTTENTTSRVQAQETTRDNADNNMENANRTDARWGIIIAVIVIIAVVAVIFFLMRRR